MTVRAWAWLRRGLPWPRAVLVWVLCAALPVGPYTLPLFQGSLSDSPRAYLAWIPLLAFAWAAWNLLRTPPQTGVRFRDTACGAALLALSGALLCAGQLAQVPFLVGQDGGLLLWPVWALGLVLLVAGLPSAQTVAGPLLYLLLVWPPLYQGILAVVNPPLERIAIATVATLLRPFPWIRPAQVFGAFDVAGPFHTTRVFVTKACSGSDSVLALLILFPIVLVWFPIRWTKKVAAVAVGCALAMAANLVRILAILGALHAVGYRFAFHILHPLLGPGLFLLLASGLLVFVSRQAWRHLPERGKAVPGPQHVGPTWLALGAGVALTAALAPMYGWSKGSLLRPLPVATDRLADLLPELPLYTLSAVHAERAADASSREGVSAVYTSPAGFPFRVALSPAASASAWRAELALAERAGDAVRWSAPVHVCAGLDGIRQVVTRPVGTGVYTWVLQTVFPYYVVSDYHTKPLLITVSAPLTGTLSTDATSLSATPPLSAVSGPVAKAEQAFVQTLVNGLQQAQ